MKKTLIIFFTLALGIVPNLVSAIQFTPQEVSAVVQITSYLPKETIDKQIRALAGFYNSDELAQYRDQLEVQTQLGSGVMVTYSGCALTAKHVVYDNEIGATHQNIHLWSTADLNQEPKDLGEATVVLRLTLVDIALVCLKDSQGKFYPHFFLKPDDYKDFKLTLGEGIFKLGYPLGGEKQNLTLAGGLMAGVYSQDYLKADLAITGGDSGGPILNSQKQLFSLAIGNTGEFASAGLLLNPIYVYGWRNYYKQVYREVIREAAGCSDSSQFGIYRKKGKEFYDLSCKIKRDPGLESKIRAEQQKYCQPSSLTTDQVIEVAEYIASGKSTINHWSDYLEKSCSVSELPVTVFENPPEE